MNWNEQSKRPDPIPYEFYRPATLEHAFKRSLTDAELQERSTDELWDFAARCHAPCDNNVCDACAAFFLVIERTLGEDQPRELTQAIFNATHGVELARTAWKKN